MLLTPGSHTPYYIDLSSREIGMPYGMVHGPCDPFSITVFALKELILRTWEAEWGDKPPNPDKLSLVHFGELLDDREQLTGNRYSGIQPP